MPTVIPVRTHFSVQDLWFDPQATGAQKGDHVVVTTERGTEFGLATADPFEAPKDEVKGELKPVLRIATDDDIDKAEELAVRGDEAMPVFRELVKASGLDMKPVGVEFLFGGEKVVFYFAAEDRVDFRDLVRDLASHFKQRVDMRQIGVRDEARLVGGYAPCGQELCCVRFGGEFEPVSIRMAKEQDLPLNSSKISGVCGRLMCCLRYEFEAYRDFKQRAPKKNALIDTPLGKAKIVEYNTPRETLTLRLENGKSFVVALKDMTCSEGCCKRAAEQNIPLRPDTVTREALEQLGTADIIMQLAELDRINGDGAGYVLDDSLLEVKRTPRRRSPSPTATGGEEADRDAQRGEKRKHSQKGAETEAAPDAGRTPRRRSQQTAETNEGQPAQSSRRQRKAAAGADKQPAALRGSEAEAVAQEAAPEQKRQPRGGGMRPRRTNKAVQPQQQAGGNARQKAADKPRGKSAEGTPAQPAGPTGDQRTRRTRRHHAAGTESAAQPGAGQERRQREDAGQEQAAEQGATRTRRTRQPQAQQSGNPSGQQTPDQQRTRQRRQHRSAQQGSGEASGGQQAQQGSADPTRQPRKRRPGDKGGSANADKA